MAEHQAPNVNALVDHLFRHESGKMVSVLTRILGMNNLDVAHDIVQDTLLKAMSQWRYGDVPANPAAWLYTVAKNKAIDYYRTERSRQKAAEASTEDEPEARWGTLFTENEIEDSVLRMIFVCCHPSIPEESQIALSLKTLCGLSTSEIARAFLTSEDTVAKRIYRAKEKIITDKIPLEVPKGSLLQDRLDNVLHVLYLLFNEGYNSSNPDELIRKDLCAEAMRLCFFLTQRASTNQPACNALLALMCFQSSRLDSRIDDNGNIITLKYQDRKTWNKALIEKGQDYLDLAAEANDVSVYHLEAAIAALHASSPSFEQTDWKSVYDLYEILYSMKPSPVVALNKAIASSYAISFESALEQLRKIKGLEKHYLFHAAVGEVCMQLNMKAEAKHHFEIASTLTSSHSEQQLLREKVQQAQ
jgi:RNA polymerase sigma factor (sigma-70 family)